MWGITILTAMLNGVLDFFSDRNKIKEATSKRKDELKKLGLEAKIKAIENSQEVNLQLDAINGRDTIPWGNDVTLILLLIPCILSFYPPAVPAIKAGFIVLDSMPSMYKYALCMAFVSIWGYRALVVPLVKVAVSKSFLGKGSK